MNLSRYIIWLPLFFLACNSHPGTDSGNVTITAELSNAENIELYFEELTIADTLPLDSLHTDANGRLSFSIKLDEAGFYVLRNSGGGSITLLLEPGESVRLKADATNLAAAYTVSGSRGSELLAVLNTRLNKSMQQLDSLSRIYRAKKNDPDFGETRYQLDKTYQEIFHEHQQFVMDFIEENPHSLASIIALYQYFGNRLVLKESEHFHFFDLLSTTLYENHSSNRHVLELRRRVNEISRQESLKREAAENLQPGMPAPEILLPDPDGNTISLSSLRGQVVLIDFWAAWCPPCRNMNRKLMPLYNEYRPRGFEIYAVSLDRNMEQWLAGIREDRLEWIQVSDLRFWSSPVVQLYGVTGIPYNLLVDRKGNIIAKGLDIQELKSELGRIFAE